MSTNAHADQESIAPEHRGSYDVPKLGIDATGAVHYYDATNDRVLVTADDDVTHVEDLDGRQPSEWAAYVAARRGWEVNYLDAGLVAAIETAVEAARG